MRLTFHMVWVTIVAMLLSGSVVADTVTLSNRLVSVAIDETTGCLTVTDRSTSRVWTPDPWLGSAGTLSYAKAGAGGWWDLSRASEITINRSDAHTATIKFRNRAGTGGMPEWTVTTAVSLAPDAATLRLSVVEVTMPQGTVARTLTYPERPFSLRTDVDRGAAVIPFWQGVVIPSYIFPMNGGRFCMWDDAQHGSQATGELRYYNWDGLVMPWFGVHDDRSAAMAVVPYDGSVGMRWIANYNNYQTIASRQHRRSPYPRILSLAPVWYLDKLKPETSVSYYLLPHGNHVTMAKQYRQLAENNGLHVSLAQKARQNADVNKLKGALYAGIYGGYPHYVNLKGMAFTFDDLDRMVRDMHDNLGLKRAFVHAWGTFSNYAPVMWPISEELGGAAKLKRVVDRVKSYGWLYSSYHSFVSLLDHDPKFNLDLAPKDEQGQPVLRGRWKAVDEDRWAELAKGSLWCRPGWCWARNAATNGWYRSITCSKGWWLLTALSRCCATATTHPCSTWSTTTPSSTTARSRTPITWSTALRVTIT